MNQNEIDLAKGYATEDELYGKEENMEEKYTNPKFIKFVNDCKKAGIETEHYNGRFFYHGPAARCDNIQDVLSIIKVKCHYDNMGLGWIVYPIP